ncbi:MAG TPA: hypothetical protein VH854_16995 [Thermoanaerobaculia bacterium]|nr:hypothetical protein [Thermoanaerobaculia bacterium]
MPEPASVVTDGGVRMSAALCGEALATACVGQWDGQTERLVHEGVDLVGSLRILYPALCARIVHGCNRWRPTSEQTLEENILHLEDCHGFTREHIVEWLREHGF